MNTRIEDLPTNRTDIPNTRTKLRGRDVVRVDRVAELATEHASRCRSRG